jgi:hypothetical protein
MNKIWKKYKGKKMYCAFSQRFKSQPGMSVLIPATGGATKVQIPSWPGYWKRCRIIGSNLIKFYTK